MLEMHCRQFIAHTEPLHTLLLPATAGHRPAAYVMPAHSLTCLTLHRI